MFTNSPLLMIDWGIGGLSVHRALKKARADAQVIYVSDSGSVPYGKQSATSLASRLSHLLQWGQRQHGCAQAILACNAASTVIPLLHSPIPVVGMIDAGLRLMKESGHRRIAVIGGLRTVESGAFQAGMATSGLTIECRAAQPLSALVESGQLAGPLVEEAVERVVAPLQGFPALLLACTHYPALSPVIKSMMPNTELLDPAFTAIQSLPLSAIGSGADRFYTSGDAQEMARTARLAFGVELEAMQL